MRSHYGRSRRATPDDLLDIGVSSALDIDLPTGDAALVDPTRQPWTFHRYDQAAIDRSLDGFELVDGSPGVSVLHDVLYVPGLIGLYTAEGNRIDHTCIRRGRVPDVEVYPQGRSRIRPPSRIRRVSTPLIYVGHPFFNHYGHFLTESISRLWYTTEDTETPLLCHDTRTIPGPARRRPPMPRPRRLRRPHVAGFHALTGVDPDRYLSFDSPVLLDQVLVPAATFVLGSAAFVRHAALPEDAARRALPDDLPRTGQPLYLSRSALSPLVRKVHGEAELTTRLEAAGFAIAHPERLALREQIELINRHEVVVGVEGSAMHNVLFLAGASSTMVYLAKKPAVSQNYLRLDAMKPTSAAFVGALDQDSTPAPRFGKRQTWLDLECATAGLADLGLVDR